MTARLRELPVDHLLTMQEAAEWLRVSRWSVYALIHANQLDTIKIGRRRLVSREALNECVKQLAKGAA
jgi:excisionase family DNA binding protein